MRGILRWHGDNSSARRGGSPQVSRALCRMCGQSASGAVIAPWCGAPDLTLRFAGHRRLLAALRRIDRSLGTGGAKDRERGPTRIRSRSDLQTPRRRVSVAGGSSCIAIRCPTIRARRITASIARSCSHGARRFVDLADQQVDRSAVVRRRRMRQLRVGGRGTYCSMTTPASRSPLAFRCAATWVGPTAPGAHRSSSPSCFGALPSRNSMRPSASGRTVNALSDAPS